MPTATPPRDDDTRGVDLTPMLDVVFILLIFFLVTATFVRESGIPVDRPESDRHQVVDSASMLVRIDDANRIWLGNRDIDPRALRANLERLAAESGEDRVVVEAHEASWTDTLVRVMDAARAAGLYDVSLVNRS